MNKLIDTMDISHLIAGAGLARRIAGLIAPTVEDLGFELVRVRDSGGIVQIMAERPDATMRVADCETLSRALSALLDVEDPVPGGYTLEVSSPGIDRPLTRPIDFERWTGYEAKIELNEMLAGRKRFRGQVQGFDEDEGEILLEMAVDGFDEPQTIGLPFAMVGDAKLVMSDILLKTSLRKSKQEHEGKGVA